MLISKSIFVKKIDFLRRESLNTKIAIDDLGRDHLDYPIIILVDSDTTQYVDASIFYLYARPIAILSSVHGQGSDKKLYFTNYE